MQGVGPELEAGLHLHDHEVLVQAGVELRDRPLPEGVVQHRVDRRRIDAQARGAVAVDLQRELRRRGLLVARQVGDLRQLRQRVLDDRRPLVELGRVDIRERVLILRRGQAAADIDVLHRLHEQPDAHHRAGRLIEPARSRS